LYNTTLNSRYVHIGNSYGIRSSRQRLLETPSISCHVITKFNSCIPTRHTHALVQSWTHHVHHTVQILFRCVCCAFVMAKSGQWLASSWRTGDRLSAGEEGVFLFTGPRTIMGSARRLTQWLRGIWRMLVRPERKSDHSPSFFLPMLKIRWISHTYSCLPS